MINQMRTVLTDGKKTALLFAAALAGVLLITVAGMLASSQNEKTSMSEPSLEKYIADMEERLCRTVSRIDGAGKVNVFISAENSFETVYASNATLDESGDETKSSKTTQKQLAYANNRSQGETPVVVKQLCPKISGILIVCEGGADSTVRAEIQNAVSVAVGVLSHKIYVTGGLH